VPIRLVMLDAIQLVPVGPGSGEVVVLEGPSQPVTMVALVLGGLRRRRHDDMGVTVVLGAVGTMRVLDHLEQAVLVGFRVMLVTVLVLVIVPMRH
jgi:hypothetical protein